MFVGAAYAFYAVYWRDEIHPERANRGELPKGVFEEYKAVNQRGV